MASNILPEGIAPEDTTGETSIAVNYALQVACLIKENWGTIVTVAKLLKPSEDVSKQEIREATSLAKREAFKKQLKFIQNLRSEMPGEAYTELTDLADKCEAISLKVLNIMKNAKPKTGDKNTSWIVKAKNCLQKSELEKLEAKLSECQQQLGYQVSFTILPLIKEHGDIIRNIKDELMSLRSYLEDDIKATIDAFIRTQEDRLSRNIHQRVKDSLRFEEMDDRYNQVQQPSKGTYGWVSEADNGREFDWLFDDIDCDSDDSSSGSLESRNSEHNLEMTRRKESIQKFLHWLSSATDNQVFHISGKLGSGKSTLMKFLIEHPRIMKEASKWAGNKTLKLCQFFFWKPGSELQNSTDGLCRSLLFSILDVCPDLLPEALPPQWEQAQKANLDDRSSLPITPKTINDALNNLLTGADLYKDHRFLFFIDGLDEYKESDRKDHKHLVQMLLKWSRKSDGNLKICVSSREHNVYMNSFSKDYRLRLHELTRHDMRIYVRKQLGDSRFDSMRDKLVEAIVSKAQGIFLWAVLVVKRVRDRIEDGDDLKTLLDQLNEVPSKLDKAFQHILDQHDEKKKRRAYLTLAMLALARRYDTQITLFAYSYLAEYEKQKDFATCLGSTTVLQKKVGSIRLVEEACSWASKQLHGCCRGLLEISECGDTRKISKVRKRRLEYTHRSVPNFFENHAKKQSDREALDGFNAADALSNILWAEMKALNRAAARTTSDQLRLANILQMRHDAGIEVEPYSFTSDVNFFQRAIHSLQPPKLNGTNLIIHLGHNVMKDGGREHAQLQLTSPEGSRVPSSRREEVSIFLPLLTTLFLGDCGFFQKSLKKNPAILQSAFSRGLIARVCLMNGHIWERVCALGHFTTKTMVACETAEVSPRPPFTHNASLGEITVWQQFIAVSFMNWTLAWIVDKTDNPVASRILGDNMAWFLQRRVNKNIKMFLHSNYIGDDNFLSVNISFGGCFVKFRGPKICRGHKARRDELIQQFLPHMADGSFQRWIRHLQLVGINTLMSSSTEEQVSRDRPRKRRKVGGA